jgi:hypothetical protein
MFTADRTQRLYHPAHPRGRTALLAVALAFSAACAERTPSAPDAPTQATLTGLIAQNNSAIQSIAAAAQQGTTRGQGGNGSGPSSAPSASGFGLDFGFPAALALTAAQQSQVTALRTASAQATAADSAALKVIFDRALAARASGSPVSVDQILASSAAIRTRLEQAEQKLRDSILAVLTPAQRDWLAKCTGPRTFTPQQQQQIAALQAAFDQSTASYVAAIQAALLKIEALRKGAGAGTQAVEQQIRAIIDAVLPARQSLSAAAQQLAKDLSAITAISGCAG